MAEANALSKVWVSGILCREVIIETSEIPTAFRISDKITTNPLLPEGTLPDGSPDLKGQQIAVFHPAQLKAIIVIHSESPRDFGFSVTTRRPNGSETHPVISKPMRVDTPGVGIMLNTEINIGTTFEGVHWMEFWIDGEVANKLPITIVHPPGLENHLKLTLDEWANYQAGTFQIPLGQSEENKS
jgi:hypothetical protein